MVGGPGGLRVTGSELVVEVVSHEVAAVVGGLAPDEHVVMVEDLLERQDVVVVVISWREQVVHLLFSYLSVYRLIIV